MNAPAPSSAPLPCVALQGGGVEFEVLVSPGSVKACVRGIHGSALKVAVHAPPEKGKANSEVEDLLAAYFSLPSRQVRVVSGLTSRKKRVQCMGLTAALLQAKLAR
ncbi:MAG: DUF167 domain-containing protein [Planctomycetes bacterium]|nr:DUF167 domain-containing protein [Planctomycetota bacterium]